MAAPKPDYSLKSPVLVTGATGYVAGWLIKRLLEEGKTVHGTVRDLKNKSKVKHLLALEKKLPGTLKLFQADLLEEGAFDEAVKGCGIVFHTASPFSSKITDPQRDLVDPAVKGTRNVLDAVNKTKSVKRVVLTSSFAAVCGDLADCARAPGGKMTEDMWNTSARLDYKAYAFSKVQAEKTAWEMQKAQDRWSLVTINPSLIVGPSLSNDQTSESFNMVKRIGDGSMKDGATPQNFGCIDVRDVAEAHMRAGFIKSAQGRYIVVEKPYSYLAVAEMLREAFGESYPFPRRKLSKWWLWLKAPFVGGPNRETIAKNFGQPWGADNSKSIRELGMEYRPARDAVVEMFQQLVDQGKVKPSS